MTKSRTWSAGAAVLAALLIVAAWFVLISPQRSEAADLRDQASQQQQLNEQIKLKTAQLKAQFASLPARQARPRQKPRSSLRRLRTFTKPASSMRPRA